MAYSIYVTDLAQESLDSIVFYLLLEKNSEQAANAVLDDYDETIDALSNIAGNLGFCTNFYTSTCHNYIESQQGH